MPLNIAIDGPVGAGKSTIASDVARAMGILHLDTGAMYRALALAALQTGTDWQNESAVTALCARIDIGVAYAPDGQHTFLMDEDVSEAIRLPEVSQGASAVSRYAGVRTHMVSLQRAYAQRDALVMDGRDIGTHVLPNAPFKFYLDAEPEERARRRLAQLHAQGVEQDFASVLSQLKARDAQDMQRAESPLRCAADALRIDTTHRTQAETVAQILSCIRGCKA